jgi:hypothetical protein
MSGTNVNSAMERYTAIVSRLSTAQRLAWLVGVTTVVYALAAPFAYNDRGAIGLQAVTLAAAVSLVGALIAVLLASRHRGTPAAVAWILAGDMLAMALPLITGTIISRQTGPLAEAGAFQWIVLFFLTSLVAKTALVAPLAQASKSSASSPKTATAAVKTETTQVGA